MDDLVKELRIQAEMIFAPSELMEKAAKRIEYLERELSEERHSREVASQKAWEFADRIKELESSVAELAKNNLSRRS